MKYWTIAAVAVFIWMIAAMYSVNAQGISSICKPKKVLETFLLEAHREVPVAQGLSDQTLITVYAEVDTGNFTITLTGPDKISCVVSSGLYWRSITFEGGEKL